MKKWLSDLLLTHGSTLLYAFVVAVITWLSTNMIAKPVLNIRQNEWKRYRPLTAMAA